MTNNEKALELVQKCLDDWPYAATRVIDIMKRLEQVKALLKEQRCATITEPDCRICGQSHCKYYHESRKPIECKSYVRMEGR